MLSLQDLTTIIDTYLPEPHSSLMNGILFGRALRKSNLLYFDLKKTGLLHMVVLSGTNITILSAMLGSVLRFLPKKLAVSITICSIIAFIVFIGPQAPSIRAAVMGIISLLAIIFNRKALAMYSLLISALYIALFHRDLFLGISFQLSFAATLGMILFSTSKSNDSVLFKELRTTLSAQIFTTPILFFYFKQISLISPIANILVGFIVPPLMAFGFITVILGTIWWQFGYLLSFVLYSMCSYVIFVIRLLGSIPFGYFDLRS